MPESPSRRRPWRWMVRCVGGAACLVAVAMAWMNVATVEPPSAHRGEVRFSISDQAWPPGLPHKCRK